MKITFEVSIEELEKLFGEVDEKTEEKRNETEEDSWNELSPYTKWFDEDCVCWENDPEYNRRFLIDQQNYCNYMLRIIGHLYLNEVYDELGFAHTKAGTRVGWVYNKKNPIGDNYVNFGLDDPRNQDFINGKTTNALLVFNVDGVIIDKI